MENFEDSLRKHFLVYSLEYLFDELKSLHCSDIILGKRFTSINIYACRNEV